MLCKIFEGARRWRATAGASRLAMMASFFCAAAFKRTGLSVRIVERVEISLKSSLLEPGEINLGYFRFNVLLVVQEIAPVATCRSWPSAVIVRCGAAIFRWDFVEKLKVSRS